MHKSSIDQSEGQKNRRVREALELLRWLSSSFHMEEFDRAAVLEDRSPIEENYTAKEIAAFRVKERRLEAAFQLLLDNALVEPATSGHQDHVVTDAGKKRAEKIGQQLLRLVYQDRGEKPQHIHWHSLGGKPFARVRPLQQLAEDLLMQITTTPSVRYAWGFDKATFVGQSLRSVEYKQNEIKRQRSERGRMTAALNLLEKHGLIEKAEELGTYRITADGDTRLD